MKTFDDHSTTIGWRSGVVGMVLSMAAAMVGCGGSDEYDDPMLASAKPDPADSHQVSINSSTSSNSATPVSDLTSDSLPKTARAPIWETATVPTVVPYVSEEETAEERAQEGLPPAAPLPAGFFTEAPDEPVAPSAPAPSSDSFAPAPASVESTSAPPTSVPVDPRPGSTPGRPNPFGFPSNSGDGHNHASNSPRTTQNSAASDGSRVPQVRLSTAVALAQSLPTGTAMGFSMNYVFLSDFLPNARYAWVIQPPKGKAVAFEVSLKQQGSLSQFVTQWGPNEGTYKMQLMILDGKDQPHPMSRAIDAYYAY